jgi:hypothetical protein
MDYKDRYLLDRFTFAAQTIESWKRDYGFETAKKMVIDTTIDKSYGGWSQIATEKSFLTAFGE